MTTYSKKILRNIIANFSRCPSNKDVLQYLFDKNKDKIKNLTNMEEFQLLKKQHLIKYSDSFYRKSSGKNQIYEICYETERILLEQEPTSKLIEIDQTNVNKLTYLTIPIKHYKKDTIVYHGTPYQMPLNTDYMPYNWVGNWFGTTYEESKAYAFEPSALYKYKVSNDFDVIHIDKEDDLNYLLVHIAFMETIIDKNNNDILSLVKYARGIETRTFPMIEKYNYTIGKNLLDSSGENQYGLFDKTNTTKISDTFKYPINIPSSGDGDKPLAGAICNIYNSKDTDSININGWEITDINHLMICNPTEVLVNISVENYENNVYCKGEPGYPNNLQSTGGYYFKYLKYKAKYLKLKKQNQSN
jgi:hypothetical protein